MANWIIYGSDNVAKATVKELELHDEWMAECFLTVSVKSAEPIAFAVGDYIDYRGERYTIQYDPNVLKKAESGSYGEGFTYDNIKFVGLQDEVVRCDFNDIVLNDNNVHYTALPTFPFYCETVDDLLDRIQANLEELYPGQWIVIGLNTVRNSQRGTAVGRAQAFVNAYKQYIDPTGAANTEPYGKQGVAETVDNITCWDAMKKVHDDFELNFIVRGRVIIVGTAGVFTANTFRYGKGNGLYEIERIGDSDQQIVTRLRAYGSEQNLPQHYYATQNKDVYATITNLKNKFSTQGAEFILDLDFDKKYFTYQSVSYPTTGSYPNYIVTIKANDISVRAYVTKDSISNKCYVYCEYTGGMDDRDEPDASAMASFVTALANGDKVYFEDYVKKETFGEGHYEFASENLPDNMSVSRLMMPGFPNQSLHDWVEAHKNLNGYEWLAQAIEEGFTFSTDKYRPYIDSPNIDEYGVRPGSVMFDGSNETEDIHPTIEGMMYGNAPVDEIYAADQVEDNGVYPAGEEVKNINVILPSLGFDLDKVFEDGATIDMKNGMCGARSFKIANTPTKDSNNRWICNIERVHDDSLDLWFPYEDFQIHGSSEVGRDHGDKYVLTGITMPDEYIAFAAEKLLQAAIDALKKNHAPRYTYQPRIDELWMQRQHDSSLNDSDVVSLHDTLKAGDVFAFADDDLNIDANIIIDILTIRENGNNGVPTYEITLRDEKEVGTIQKIANKIDSAFSSAMNGAGGGSGLTPQQIQSLVRKEGNDRYLSKTDDDTAKGNISFEKNINVGGRETVNELQSTEYTGDGLLDTGYRLWYEEGRAKLVIDDLVARGKFTANELETRIWTYAGGNMVFSGAGSTLFFVEYLDGNENPLGYTYINQPWLLRGRALLAGGLAWSKRKAIQRELTEAEKAQVVKFRCYEYSDDGTMQTRNWWKPNDIAMCETLNKVREKAASDGSYSGSASNTVYKRRIAGIGSKEIPMLNDGRVYDYVDLWNIYDLAGNSCKYKGTDGQEHLITDNVKGYDSTYHDWPAAGDVIVQMGNPLDTDRQSAVTIEVQGDVHGFKVYDTISDYSMANKLWVEIGYDQTTGKAKANVFGDFRFGCRENEEANGGSYIKYNRTTKQLDIRANVRFMSPTTQQETSLDAFANAIVGELDEMQAQIDGQIEAWFYDYAPVTVDAQGAPTSKVPLNVEPYKTWNDADVAAGNNAQKIAHLGDTFTNDSSGYSWRFTQNATTQAFEWNIIEDSAVITALQNAARAQDTADHKRRTFLLPVTISGVTYNYPYPPYDVGDLWVNANYPATGTKTYENEMLRCGTSKAEGQSFDISDWGLANGYTAKLNNFMTNTYAPFVTQISNQVDKKAETFRQANDPSVDWYDDTQVPVYDVRVHHVGDLWMDISADGGKKTYIYENTGSAATPNYEWVEQDVPDDVFDEIDGKAEIFVEKPTDYCERDMWIIESGLADADLPPNCKKGDIVVADNMPAGTTKREGTYVKGDWRKKDRYTDDTKANEVAAGLTKEITDRGQAVAAAQAAAAQDATNKVNAASQQLTEAINAVDDAHSTVEGALEDGYIDNDEREALKAVLKSLDAEFSDVTASYSVVYNNDLLNGTTQKTALNTAYTALVSAHDAYDAAFTSFIDAPSTTKYEKGDSEGDYTYTPEGAQEEVTVNLTTLQTTFNTCAATYQTALENANAKIQDKIKEIADAATAEITSYRYIKNALGATTVTQGGLMLTSAIFLRQLKQDGDPTKDSDYTTWSGINGTTPDGQSSIAAWYGGDMVDYEGLTPEQKAAGWGTGTGQQRYAKTLFRMDGTGYMAGGKIHWDSNGDGFVAGGNVAWSTNNQGVTSVTINGATVQNAPSVNTQQLLLNGTDITSTLNAILSMFTLEGAGTSASPYIIKANYSFYSVGDVSAMGQSSGGGGGGGGGASVMYQLNDVKPDSTVNPTKVYGASEGKVLTYGSDGKWYASDLLLPKSGGTMTGNITMGTNAIVFNEYHTSDWNVGSNSGIKILNTVGQSATGAPNKYAIGLSVSGYYRFQLAAYGGGGGGSLKFRNGTRGEYEDWVTLIDSSTIGSQSVASATTAEEVLKVSSGTTIKVAQLVDNNLIYGSGHSGNTIIYGGGDKYICNANGGTIQLAVKSDGNVGIGTYTPSYKLEVSGSANATTLYENGTLLSNIYLALSGGTMTGVLTLPANLYDGYETSGQTYAINANNSDIVNVNSILTSDVSGSWKESIGFKRTNGNWDTFRAADGTFYFGVDSGTEYTAVHSGNIGSQSVNYASSAGNADTLDNIHGTGFLRWQGMQNIGAGAPYQACLDILNDKTQLNDGAKLIYSYLGEEYTVLFSSRNDNTRHGTILKWGYTDKYIRIIRVKNGAAEDSDWAKISAGYADTAGGATNDSDGNAINTTYAKIGAHNNLTASGNEFTFASSGLSGSVYFNYRTAGGTNGNITEYVFGNGKGGSLGTALHTGNYSSYALAKSGGTMTGVLTLKGSQYAGYMTGSSKTYAVNANNSDIVGVNALIMADKSDGWTESIGFPRDGSDAGHYDTFRAANGTFYFGFNGYFDSSNVEHAASELVTITGTTIKLQRADSSTASVRMKNTSRDISLDAGSTNCGVYYQTGSKWLIGTNGTDTWLSTGKVGIGTTSPSQLLHVSGGLIAITNNSRTLTIGAQNSSAIHIYNDNNSGTYFNGIVSSNGNGAYDLGTSTYPWKKLYAQGCEIYATSPSVHVGTSSSARISLHWSSDNNRGLYDYSGYWVIGANTNTFLMRGNVGIGTTSPSYKLHVSGDIYATGGVTSASDERMKDVVGDITLSVEQIAKAPAVRFLWKRDHSLGEQVGTIAQYWQKTLPQSVSDKADELSLQYGVAGLLSAIVTARKVVDHEERIKALEEENRELRKELKRLKSA